MKKNGILNPQLSEVIASFGHSDKMVICDCGLPIPPGAERIDLVLKRNTPRFIETVRAVLSELHIESAIVAEELEKNNPAISSRLVKLLPGVQLCKVAHDEFKRIVNEESRVVFVRTGEASPYANVILVSGVTF